VSRAFEPIAVNFADHLLAFILVVIGPLRSGTVGIRRLRRADAESLPAVRRGVYHTAVLLQWGLAAAVLVLWLATRRGPAALGLEPRLTAGLAGVLAGALVVAAVLLRQRSHALRDPAALAEIRDRMRPLERMLPHGRGEWTPFVRLSLTAGVCEELLYRGFLTWYFSHVLGWWAAAGVAAVAFGLAHAYQGVRGVALTTLVGAFLAAIYAVSGSIYLGMLLHALMDLHSGHLAWRAYEAEPHEPRGEAIAAEAGAGEAGAREAGADEFRAPGSDDAA